MKLEKPYDGMDSISVKDKSLSVFNTDLVETLRV